MGLHIRQKLFSLGALLASRLSTPSASQPSSNTPLMAKMLNNPPLSPADVPASPSMAQTVRVYTCQCGQAIYFVNSRCLACGTALGYDPDQGRLMSLAPGATPGLWVDNQVAASAYVFCANRNTPATCNWLLPESEQHAHGGQCRACRLNRTIPNLNDPDHPDNGELWGRVEQAKRRLVSALLVMGLPVASRETEDTVNGLMFDILCAARPGEHVMTGHDDGLITLNVAEADDAQREHTRRAMNEPYRTLVGHFRHEIGHYYWYRLVDNPGSGWLPAFRDLFGDENQDYAESLKRSYEAGPRPDWPQHFVSAYASVHPWEDWAECWAHYMHMRDTVDTAASYGLSLDAALPDFTPFDTTALYLPAHPDAEHFLAFLNHWTQLTTMLNGMSRAMGQPDFYPFVLPREVVAKLHFIHLLVMAAAQPLA
jgi:hypothetical protein